MTDCGVSFRSFVKLTLGKVGIDRALKRKVNERALMYVDSTGISCRWQRSKNRVKEIVGLFVCRWWLVEYVGVVEVVSSAIDLGLY